MIRRCLTCDKAFEANQLLEHLPLGFKVAFDPQKGRLWLICRSCRRWSLVPIEARWEALEELARLTKDKARLLTQTDNIALFRHGPLELVRVGKAKLVEEAWWRYGRELTNRRKRFQKLSAVGAVGAGATIAGSWATGGVGFVAAWVLWDRIPSFVTGSARWFQFGGHFWRGNRECQRCGFAFTKLSYGERDSLVVRQRQEGGTDLVVRCPRCGDTGVGGLTLQGHEADRALRRVLAYHHFSGASARRVEEATRLIEVAGGAASASSRIIRDGRRLGDLGRVGGVALEIAANDEVERELLQMEVSELDAHWRREEELADISDRELSPPPPIEALRLRITNRS